MMPTYNHPQVFAQPVAMQCTSAQIKHLVHPLTDMGYIVDTLLDQGWMITHAGQHFFASTIYMFDWTDRYLVSPYNWRLFLAIAAMTTGEKFITGEYGVALGDIGGDKIREGAIFRMHDVDGDGVEVQGIGWVVSSCFRKATLTEIIEYFNLLNL